MAELPPHAELLPGRYAIELELPAPVLDALVWRPRWRERVEAYVTDNASANVDVLGGGVQHNADGTRVLAFAFDVVDPSAASEGGSKPGGGDAVVAPAAVPVVPVLVILSAVAIVAGVSVSVVIDRRYRIRRLDEGYPPSDVAEVSSAVRAVAWAAGVGLVAWVFGRRLGVSA